MTKFADKQKLRKPRIKDNYNIEDLIHILSFLRSPEGCPWDREQSHESIKHNLIEEAYEVIDAINANSAANLQEELGDVLMQVVFHAQIAAERGDFDFNDVVNSISNKLISRHTHVFGNDSADNPEEVLLTWEQNKKIEKGHKSQTEVLRDVPRAFPALTRAFKVQKKAAQVGFDWPDSSGSKAKILEELGEVQEQVNLTRNGLESNAETAENFRKDVEREAGDLLFAVVNYLRSLQIEPEVALNLCTDNFILRFSKMEEIAQEKGRGLESMTLDELDSLWEEAKKRLGQ